jgi:hypothetical protein
MQLLRAQRAHIEEELRSSTSKAIEGVAEWAAALAKTSDSLTQAVAAARAAGASWGDVGRAVGVSRQAARQRWGVGEPDDES